MVELKTEVENMGASNEDICQEILEGQFDGVNFPSFNSHGKILPYIFYFTSWFFSLFGLIMKR